MSRQAAQRSWMIHIRKDYLKFSAAHMTVFADGSKKSLHGHNYQVELTVELTEPALAHMLSYDIFKQALKTVCHQWDEKVLIAGRNPYLETLAAAPDEYAFRLCGKRYILPADEVVVLAVDNITAENLAQALFERLWDELNRDRSVPWRERTIAACLRIDESLGQGASYRVQWEH